MSIIFTAENLADLEQKLAKKFRVKPDQIKITGQRLVVGGRTKSGYKIFYHPNGKYTAEKMSEFI